MRFLPLGLNQTKGEVKFMLIFTYGKYPKVQPSFSKQSTNVSVPTVGFLSAEAKIPQKEIIFASYIRIMERTDIEKAQHFIYLDLSTAFNIALRDIVKSRQIRSRRGHHKNWIRNWLEKSRSE